MTTSKYIWLILLSFCCTTLHAQKTNTKGSNSLIIKKKKTSQNTKAVIVGISNYQDPDIPDLKYAHKDAEAYAEYLMSPAGGTIPKKNIKVFLNEEATGGNVHGALDWLVKNTKKNEQCLIYFSGHGDVETLYEKEPGHFLVYDTPSETYQVNSLRVEDLQKIITKLSNEIGAKVTVITDACRSGKLAGSDINGSQATAAALLQQFSNEIKIMSCQADEYSFEGEQWGGGRGMFSYHMIKGLIGLADNNKNNEVSLKELQRHLEDQFEMDLYDGRQTPVMIGDRRATIAQVNTEAFKELQEDNNDQLASSGQDDTLDENTNELLTLFYKALNTKNLIAADIVTDTESLSALQYLEQLEQSDTDPSRIAIAKGDLIAALQDDAQQAINLYLSLDPKEIENRWNADGSNYSIYAQYLGTAADLLGEFHYIYPQVKAKELYFDVVSHRIDLDRKKASPEEYHKLINVLEEALVFQPRSPFINNEMGLLWMHSKNYDEAIAQFKKAIEISPTWAMPYNNVGYVYYLLKNWDKAIDWYDETLKRSDNIKEVYANLYETHLKLNNYKEVAQFCNKYLSLDSTNCKVFNDLGYAYYKSHQNKKAETALLKAISCNAEWELPYLNLADLYRSKNDYSTAIEILNKALSITTSESNIYYHLGRNYALWNKSTMARTNLKKAIELNDQSYARVYLAYEYLKERKIKDARKELEYYLQNVEAKDGWVYFDLACGYALENDLASFEKNMMLAIEYGFDDKKEMEESIFLSSIRSSEVYVKYLDQLK